MTIGAVLKKIRFGIQIGNGLSSKIQLVINFIIVSIFFRNSRLKQRLIANQKATIYALNVNGTTIELKMRLQDLNIFCEVFQAKNYRLPRNWKLSKEKPVIIDLGAHIGLATLFFSLHYFPNGHFICVEPSQKNLPLLKYNLQNIQATILENAVSYQNEMVAFEEHSIGYNHQINPLGKEKLMSAISLNHIVKKFSLQNIDLIKIDIEGAEELILRAQIEWLSKTNYFIIEIHGQYSLAQLTEDVAKEKFNILSPDKHQEIKMICGERL